MNQLLLLTFIIMLGISGSAGWDYDLAGGHSALVDGKTHDFRNNNISYLCSATYSESQDTRLEGLIVRINPESNSIGIAALAEGFQPDFANSFGHDIFQVVTGLKYYNGINSAKLREESESIWIKRSQAKPEIKMSRPYFRKDHLTAPLSTWDIPKNPAGIKEPVNFKGVFTNLLQYYRLNFDFDGYFVFPESAFSYKTKEFEAQVYLSAELGENPILQETIEPHNKENYFEVNCISDSERDSFLEQLYLNVRINSKLPDERLKTKKIISEENENESDDQVPTPAQIIATQLLWKSLSKTSLIDNERKLIRHIESMATIAGAGSAVWHLTKRFGQKVTLIGGLLTISSVAFSAEKKPENCININLYVNLRDMDSASLVKCIKTSPKMLSEFQALSEVM